MYSLDFEFNFAKKQFAKIKYFHNEEKNTRSAFLIDEKGGIGVYIPRRFGTVSASLILFGKWGEEELFRADMSWQDTEKENDLYYAKLDLASLGVGLYFYTLELDTAYGRLYIVKSTDGCEITTSNEGNKFQLSVSDFKYKAPENKYGGIIYHIFVDRFAKGGKVPLKDGAILVSDFDTIPEYPEYPGAPLKNNTFYGGTLYGIIDKLDYIASLGVDTLYLSPIFSSPSNHKYDTADYTEVDEMFGGADALKELISEAKARNIGIILDGVFNHTGSDSIYFNRYSKYESLGAYQSKDSPYYSWYDFKEYPDDYTAWWGIEILPRIHPNRKECGEYFTGKGGIIEKYARLGIDGFRLDVADELSDTFIASIKSTLAKYSNTATLYGEVWEDASNKIAYGERKRYYLGCELDGVMNYPLRRGIIEYIKNKDTEPLKYALTDIIDNAPKRIADFQMNLLGTHDTERILTVLGGEDAQGRTNDYLSRKRMTEGERDLAKARLKAAYTILATLPGIPTVFYGDEAGLEGYSDPFNRLPYPWGREDCELISFYQKIGRIRRESRLYADGELKLLCLDKDVLCFMRYKDEKECLITLVNNRNHSIKAVFKDKAVCLTSGTEASSEFNLSPLEAVILRTTINNDIYIY